MMRSMLFLCVALISQVGLAQQFTPVRNVLQKCFGQNCAQQQVTQVTQTVVTNDLGYDTDGARITSVGPISSSIVQPSTPTAATVDQAAPAAAIAGAVGAPATARDFRQALLKAARQERGGSLSLGDYWDIFVGSLNPQKLELAKLAVFDSGVQDGAIPAGSAIGAIDWAKLIELIIKYLPQILDLFKSQPHSLGMPITMFDSATDFSMAA